MKNKVLIFYCRQKISYHQTCVQETAIFGKFWFSMSHNSLNTWQIFVYYKWKCVFKVSKPSILTKKKFYPWIIILSPKNMPIWENFDFQWAITLKIFDGFLLIINKKVCIFIMSKPSILTKKKFTLELSS